MVDTVDGSEIQTTTWDIHNLVNSGINYLSTGAGFLNHQQYLLNNALFLERNCGIAGGHCAPYIPMIVGKNTAANWETDGGLGCKHAARIPVEFHQHSSS